MVAKEAGYWSYAKNDRSKTNWSFQELSVTMAPSHTHTVRPLINVPLDLSKVFLDEMYVGFCASTGNLIENHKTLRGTFKVDLIIIFQEFTMGSVLHIMLIWSIFRKVDQWSRDGLTIIFVFINKSH